MTIAVSIQFDSYLAKKKKKISLLKCTSGKKIHQKVAVVMIAKGGVT